MGESAHAPVVREQAGMEVVEVQNRDLSHIRPGPAREQEQEQDCGTGGADDSHGPSVSHSRSGRALRSGRDHGTTRDDRGF